MNKKTNVAKDVKFDVRCKSSDKVKWTKVANKKGYSLSEWVRGLLNKAK